MSAPPGFEGRFVVGKVCKLKKLLCELKQTPRAWFECFGKAIKNYGYGQSQADHTMFYEHSPEGKVTTLRLAGEFEIKELGSLK